MSNTVRKCFAKSKAYTFCTHSQNVYCVVRKPFHKDFLLIQFIQNYTSKLNVSASDLHLSVLQVGIDIQLFRVKISGWVFML